MASTSTPTVQSSSASQASPTASGTPTGSRSSATAAAETAATGGGTSSSNKTPIIIGVVVGAVVAAIAIWLIWFGARRRRKRIRDEATKPEREHWLQGQPSPGSDQGLGVYSGEYHVRIYVGVRFLSSDASFFCLGKRKAVESQYLCHLLRTQSRIPAAQGYSLRECYSY